MKTYIALLRGINVLGKKSLAMKELVAILEGAGCRDVATYIQSGNAVFRHKDAVAEKLAEKIGGAIEKRRGFTPHVLVIEAKALKSAAAKNPFPEAASDHKSLHLFFLDAKPAKEKVAALAPLLAKSERFEIIGTVLYFHAPDGFGRSKFAASVERKLGVPMTARNWRTCSKLVEMVGAVYHDVTTARRRRDM
jgi:uncharacterized protein (DUF1697 family)